MTGSGTGEGCDCACVDDTTQKVDQLTTKTQALSSEAKGFARAMTSAFAQSVTGGKQFEDVLKSLALKVSDLALKAALKPLTTSLATGFDSLFSGLFGGSLVKNADGAIKPFAAGGVIGTPTYFPMLGGGVGLAGEAGPEAILPLARGADGRLGVASSGGATTVNIQIATPDADSFRRSETYLTGQIARAVARGQRGL
ncbi:phage tail tape measure protein [Rhodopseudomonas palustris]|uniref:phage tail tape measure protein n=1 Tax=Rhodopseudomonas palustris TaxID=1076 RepID=UPI000164A6FE|nr:phage tail tape measure protein [Rhodopseudomonas palustris]ACF00634.1 gene transfer agent (GTA) like protein [Rhodopseudomonas palustris TIE-1]WBU31744.1 phage tail tape measure protein [Rhodopseudomonas palustris]